MRTIHPGLFTDLRYCSMSPTARVLLLALWCEADDAGVFPVHPIDIKVRLLPADNADVLDLLEEMVNAGLVMLYEANGGRWGACRNFVMWQQPRAAKYRYPQVAEVREWVGADNPRDPMKPKRDPRDLPHTPGEVLAMIPTKPKVAGQLVVKRRKTKVVGRSQSMGGPERADSQPSQDGIYATLNAESVSQTSDMKVPESVQEPAPQESQDGIYATFDAKSVSHGGDKNAFEGGYKGGTIGGDIKPIQDSESQSHVDILKGGAGGKQKPKRQKNYDLSEVEVPPWLPFDAWQLFVVHRAEIREPLTVTAARAAIRRLAYLRDQGDDPSAVIAQTVLGGWMGLFPIRGGKRNGTGGYGSGNGGYGNAWVRLAARTEAAGQSHDGVGMGSGHGAAGDGGDGAGRTGAASLHRAPALDGQLHQNACRACPGAPVLDGKGFDRQGDEGEGLDLFRKPP
jgi:hypothetical protein